MKLFKKIHTPIVSTDATASNGLQLGGGCGILCMVNTAAKNLNKAVRELQEANKIPHTHPKIMFIFGLGFVVTHYFSEAFIKRKGWFLIYSTPRLKTIYGGK